MSGVYEENGTNFVEMSGSKTLIFRYITSKQNTLLKETSLNRTKSVE